MAKGKITVDTADEIRASRDLGFKLGDPGVVGTVWCRSGYNDRHGNHAFTRHEPVDDTRVRRGVVQFLLRFDGESDWYAAEGPWELTVEKR